MKIADNITFDKFAGVWCKVCGAGDSIIKMGIGHYVHISRVIGEDGLLLDEVHNQEEDEQYYKCEQCGIESMEPDDIITENIWIAGEAYNNYRKVESKKPILLHPIEEEEEDESA